MSKLTERIFNAMRKDGTRYSESEIGNMARSAIAGARRVLSLRNVLIGLAVIALLVALPVLIYNNYKERHPEKFCAHEHLTSDGARYNFEDRMIHLVCRDCGDYILAETKYRLLEEREATCAEFGYRKERLSAAEGAYKEEMTILPALPHTYEVFRERVAPTCTEVGTTAIYKCTDCDGFTGGETIAPTGHTRKVSVKGYAATCMSTGRTAVIVCEDCGVTLQYSEVLPMGDHSYEVTTVPPERYAMGYDLHECTLCSASYKDNYTNPLESAIYYEEHDDHAQVVGVVPGAVDIIIPTYYNGKPVTRIGEAVFAGKTEVRTVSLPTTLTEIGARAFDGCTGLREVGLSEGLQIIRADAFRGCTSLREISIPGTVISLYNTAFENCTSLVRLSFGQGIIEVNLEKFATCTNLLSIRLPASERSFRFDYQNFPLLSELYVNVGREEDLYRTYGDRYLLHTDYSTPSAVVEENGSYYLEKNGERRLLLTLP